MKSAFGSEAPTNTKIKSKHKNQISITNLIELLKAIIDGYCASDCISEHLGSQRALCRYRNALLGIYPMSLNTMKATAESHQGNRYAHINDLRKQALSLKSLGSAIPKPPTRSSKASLLAQIRKLKEENSWMRQDLVIVVAQANRAMRRMVAYGKLANKEDLARKEFGEIMAFLNLVRSDEKTEKA